MKRYVSIDHIYLEKLAELCGGSYYNDNSYNLQKCEFLHSIGFSWKTIYFALLNYRSWYDKEWNSEHHTSCGSWGFKEGECFGKNKYDPDSIVLYAFVGRALTDDEKNMTAEEFFFRNMEK